MCGRAEGLEAVWFIFIPRHGNRESEEGKEAGSSALSRSRGLCSQPGALSASALSPERPVGVPT